MTYQPQRAGRYLARWRAGGETFHRYFTAIEDDWVVPRFSTFEQLQADPPMHATGIAVDYRLPADRFDPGDQLFREFLDFHRRFACSVIPLLPGTPDLSHAERVAAYGATLERVHALMPDPSNVRSARLEMLHPLDPGYTRALAELGVNDHCGLFEANSRPWLGMPEFPYFPSAVDCRKANQDRGGDAVAHQWDLCGGWHFIGPAGGACGIHRGAGASLCRAAVRGLLLPRGGGLPAVPAAAQGTGGGGAHGGNPGGSSERAAAVLLLCGLSARLLAAG